MEILTLSLLIFISITYCTLFLYLGKIYLQWKETTIGVWVIGVLISVVAIFSHAIADYHLIQNYDLAFRISINLSFVAYSTFVLAQQIARRDILDIIAIGFISMLNGLILVFSFHDLVLIESNELIFVYRGVGISNFDLTIFIYLFVNYLLLVRDSEIIYRSTIKGNTTIGKKSKAITHLLSWQFFSIGIMIIWVLNKFVSSSNIHHLIFELPMIFFLVPILTLGARPFDWTREGFEPLKLLLLDKKGNTAFSWNRDNNVPLLLEGSAFNTVKQLISNEINDKIHNMQISFDNSAVFFKIEDEYQTILITSGFHPSFQLLIEKIHKILIHSLKKPIDFGISNELPPDLKWILTQLLSD